MAKKQRKKPHKYMYCTLIVFNLLWSEFVQQTRSKVSYKLLSILILGTMNNIFHYTCTYYIIFYLDFYLQYVRIFRHIFFLFLCIRCHVTCESCVLQLNYDRKQTETSPTFLPTPQRIPHVVCCTRDQRVPQTPSRLDGRRLAPRKSCSVT